MKFANVHAMPKAKLYLGTIAFQARELSVSAAPTYFAVTRLFAMQNAPGIKHAPRIFN